MTSSARFRLNDKRVVCEKFDEEVLAINLEFGTYYSMPGVSGQIWNWLISGSDVELIKQALVTCYDGDVAAIESAAAQFIDKMQQESLIVPEVTTEMAALITIPTGVEKKPFIVPVVEMYTDLQDLLLLDPIHDVDERGWPVLQKPEAPTENKN